MARFLRFWFPVIIYSGIIFYVSSIPNLQAPFGIFNIDKIIHILEYTLFGFLLARAIILSGHVSSKNVIWALVMAGSFLYGLSDEYHQSFVIGREASWGDLLADMVGGSLGAMVYQNRGQRPIL